MGQTCTVINNNLFFLSCIWEPQKGSYSEKTIVSPVDDVEHAVLTVIGAVNAQFVQQVQQMG